MTGKYKRKTLKELEEEQRKHNDRRPWPERRADQIEKSGVLDEVTHVLLGQRLEDRIFFSNNPSLPISEYEAKKLSATGNLRIVDAVITSSFFGGLPGPENKLYFGLNIILKLQNPDSESSQESMKASVRYSKMEEIVDLMQSYGVREPALMTGKMARAYLAKIHGEHYLVALAPIKQKEETK